MGKKSDPAHSPRSPIVRNPGLADSAACDRCRKTLNIWWAGFFAIEAQFDRVFQIP
ncbi:hypothetical protein GNF10_28605 [Nostoc sp. UCD121]|uniref:hypothetical protein n=1 Tax=unclassified Nostoc TaxID=2593658 RepID=UPI0016255D27|nr:MULTISPECIES: hypothetical protein [unclassified Nostoc]MBC1219028.1 hypothetical protein [Nostoc sp. UCD120]MBC1279808.1 hypothetical protein [Nostoc sp. UCD121]MBC1296981.1 hypothetical protein [Nostoc sp. UCD122]